DDRIRAREPAVLRSLVRQSGQHQRQQRTGHQDGGARGAEGALLEAIRKDPAGDGSSARKEAASGGADSGRVGQRLSGKSAVQEGTGSAQRQDAKREASRRVGGGGAADSPTKQSKRQQRICCSPGTRENYSFPGDEAQ